MQSRFIQDRQKIHLMFQTGVETANQLNVYGIVLKDLLAKRRRRLPTQGGNTTHGSHVFERITDM